MDADPPNIGPTAAGLRPTAERSAPERPAPLTFWRVSLWLTMFGWHLPFRRKRVPQITAPRRRRAALTLPRWHTLQR